MTQELLKVKNLKTYFPVKRGVFQRTVGYLKAVDEVDLQVMRGKSSQWSANPAAARAPWGIQFWGLSCLPQGKLYWMGEKSELPLLIIPSGIK